MAASKTSKPKAKPAVPAATDVPVEPEAEATTPEPEPTPEPAGQSADEEVDDSAIIETWRIQVASTVGVLVWDRRVRDYTQSTVSGTSGSGTLRLSRADRLYNQAMVRDAQHDPFTNGMLVRLEGADVAPEFRDLTDAALAERFLAITDEDVFASLVADVLTSELTSRRVLALIRQDGRVWQVAALNDHLEQWRPGGTQRTYAEMQKAGELGQRMSE